MKWVLIDSHNSDEKEDPRIRSITLIINLFGLNVIFTMGCLLEKKILFEDDRFLESLLWGLFWKENAKSNHDGNSPVMSYV